jgi:hypothetical protein
LVLGVAAEGARGDRRPVATTAQIEKLIHLDQIILPVGRSVR